MSKINSITPGSAPFIDPEKRDFPVKKREVRKSVSDRHVSLIESIVSGLDLGDLEEIDQKAIETVKKAIAEGKYQVDTEFLADNLINEYFKKE